MGEDSVWEPWRFSLDPIVPDRSRDLPVAAITRKPAPMLDLIKVTVSLTVSPSELCRNTRHHKDLAAQLMFEWGSTPGLRRR